MKRILMGLILLVTVSSIAGESIVYDDGTGAQVSFCLPTRETDNGQEVEYGTFRIVVEKDGKFLLFADLSGARSEDGKTFSGKIVIPSTLVDSAEIIIFGAPKNSSRGIEKKFKVRDFKKVKRDKSWTDQK